MYYKLNLLKNRVTMESNFRDILSDEQKKEYDEHKHKLLQDLNLGYMFDNLNSNDIIFDIDYCQKEGIDPSNYEELLSYTGSKQDFEKVYRQERYLQLISKKIGKVDPNDSSITLAYNEHDDPFIIVENCEQEDLLKPIVDRAYRELEYTIEIAFSDQYCTCHNCNKVIRYNSTYPNDREGIVIDGEGIFCENCIDWESYIEERINDPKKAISWQYKDHLLEQGFTMLKTEFCNGLYGDNDDPQKIFEKYTKQYKEIVFVANVQAFETEFYIFYKGEGQ
jgi:hypothetical protein